MASEFELYGCQGIFTAEMENFLEGSICEREAVEIITGAPIPLEDKKTRLKILQKAISDIGIIEDIKHCIGHIDGALFELENMGPDSLIVAASCWYDIEDGSHLDFIHRSGSESFNMPYVSFEDMLDGILDEIQENTDIRDWSADEGTWYEFVIINKSKWANGRTIFEEGTYRYIMIGPEICYIEPSKRVYPIRHPSDYWGFLSGSSNLNLSVPFKSGDIVTLDCRPFAELGHLLILNAENNWDCCGLRGAFADEEGKLYIDSVKHSHCFPCHYTSRISPLYRMSSYSGQLFENEKVIKLIHLDMKHYSEKERDMYGRIFENIASNWTMFEEGFLNKMLHVE